MGIEGERRAEIDRLFEQALGLNGEDRASFLDALREQDRELAEAVEELLALGGEEDERLRPTRILGGPLWSELAGEAPPLPAGLRDGETLGPYQVLRELGRGGMAVVYLARRADGAFDQQVALKLLRPGAVAEDSLRRFEQERQILAGLAHPAIARLLDGGVDEKGRPFIALEHVEGKPIDAYCNEHRLSLEDRLKLFRSVAEAVSYAHRKLVVHRDLKPSNILVSAEGEVKLLDFGIAKLLDPAAAGAYAAPETRTSYRVLTPEYASPEQVRGEAVSTASDVYQLGLLLYELLTGERAYDLSGASPTATAEIICGHEPRRPSTAALSEEACRDRRTTSSQLIRRLKGDLDNIVLKTLRKEAERRYPSPAELVADLDRFRAGLPVQARPDTLTYRSRKFVARHRWGVAASFLIALLGVGYVATVTAQSKQIRRQFDRAQAEAAKAREVKRFLISMFEVSDPSESLGEEVTARELLDEGSGRIDEELAGQPEVQAELLGAVGEIYRRLGLYDRSTPLLRRAVELADGLEPGSGDGLRSENLLLLARNVRDLGEDQEAETYLRRSIEILRRQQDPDPAKLAEGLLDLALVLRPQGKLEEAQGVLEEALSLYRGLYGDEHPDVASTLNTLGTVAHRQGDLERAEALFRQVLEMRRKLLPPNHPDMGTSLSNLALALRLQGRAAEAVPLFEEAAGIYREVLGPDHPWTAIPLSNLAQAQLELGQGEEGEATLRRALEIRRKGLAEDHPEVAANVGDLGRAMLAQGRLEDAVGYFQRSADLYAPDHPWRAVSLSNLGATQAKLGRLEEAEANLRACLRIQEAVSGPGDPKLAEDLLQLGSVLRRRGNLEEARGLLVRALELYPSQRHPSEEQVATARAELRQVEEALAAPSS